jgi:heme O synthase-like polyprenyltransferase
MKIKLNVLIYIIITTLNVTFKFNGVTVKPILKYILSLLWIAYTIPYIFKKKKENKIAKIHFKYAIIPLAAMFIYTIFYLKLYMIYKHIIYKFQDNQLCL